MNRGLRAARGALGEGHLTNREAIMPAEANQFHGTTGLMDGQSEAEAILAAIGVAKFKDVFFPDRSLSVQLKIYFIGRNYISRG